jgi:hypothetical protein
MSPRRSWASQTMSAETWELWWVIYYDPGCRWECAKFLGDTKKWGDERMVNMK